MEAVPDTLTTTKGEKFTFEIHVSHPVPQEVDLTVDLYWNTTLTPGNDRHNFIDELYWTRPDIDRTQGSASTVKFTCNDMVVSRAGVYKIKCLAWLPEAMFRPTWGRYILLTVRNADVERDQVCEAE